MKNRLQLFFAVFAMVLLSFNGAAFGQDNEAKAPKENKQKVSGGFGFFMPGYGLVDRQALNDFIVPGSKTFADNGITLGGGGVLMVKNFMFGGEGESFLKQSGSTATQNFTFESGSGKFTLGYVVYGKKGILLYPKLGIGGYNHSLTVVDKSASNSADSILVGGFPGTLLTNKGTLFSAGLGFDWMPGFDETAGSGIVLGFEAGYNMSIKENDWESFGNNLRGGPALMPDGIYVKLHIGFAGWNRQ